MRDDCRVAVILWRRDSLGVEEGERRKERGGGGGGEKTAKTDEKEECRGEKGVMAQEEEGWAESEEEEMDK